jgi:hypothetical protein
MDDKSKVIRSKEFFFALATQSNWKVGDTMLRLLLLFELYFSVSFSFFFFFQTQDPIQFELYNRDRISSPVFFKIWIW